MSGDEQLIGAGQVLKLLAGQYAERRPGQLWGATWIATRTEASEAGKVFLLCSTLRLLSVYYGSTYALPNVM